MNIRFVIIMVCLIMNLVVLCEISNEMQKTRESVEDIFKVVSCKRNAITAENFGLDAD